ncbi:MAG: AI-2E family transporter [Yoonia sp.]|uniref:AI-2E family transporter n=1 Tax=Yoonia sp. TaxID=2212373 RepID=UPI003298E515
MQFVEKFAVPIWILAVVGVMVVLNFAATLFAPILLAVVLGVVLSPVSDLMDRFGLPRGLSAFSTLAITLLVIAVMLFLLEPVLTTAINRAPVIWYELRETVEMAQSALRGLEEAGEEVADALGSEGTGAPAEEAMVVPSATEALLYAPGYAARVMIFIGTLYFFLLSRDEVYAYIEKLDRGLTGGDMREAEKQVSRYFLTITIINASFGALVSVMLAIMGMPFPIVWGFLAALANFILYLGPPMFAVCLLVGGIVAFDGPLSFAPAVIYVVANMIEGQFVTPSLVGRTMDVNPLLVFLSLVVWLWMWGPVGGIIAIPLLVWVLALRDRYKVAVV